MALIRDGASVDGRRHDWNHHRGWQRAPRESAGGTDGWWESMIATSNRSSLRRKHGLDGRMWPRRARWNGHLARNVRAKVAARALEESGDDDTFINAASRTISDDRPYGVSYARASRCGRGPQDAVDARSLHIVSEGDMRDAAQKLDAAAVPRRCVNSASA